MQPAPTRSRSLLRFLPALAVVIAAAASWLHGASAARAQNVEDDNANATGKTLAPYFVVRGTAGENGGRGETLPLRSTDVQVHIAGVIADVAVTQVYRNSGPDPIEATYVFPGSTRAAVHGLEMQIGERHIKADIRERARARATYEAAKTSGRSATLLEQHRPNVFQMNVANILPGDEIRVILRYTELLVPTAGVYEFVFPTVVGPRYSTQPAATAPAGEQWVANPYLHAGEPSAFAFDLAVSLRAGLPVEEIRCASHPVKILYADPTSATIHLEPAAHPGNDRDFILRYRLAGNVVASGLLLHQAPTPDAENFFLLTVQPPRRPAIDAAPRLPREFLFVVDVSGSMSGFPLDTAKTLMRELLGSLAPADRFNVILFAGTSRVLSPDGSLPATRGNIEDALRLIHEQSGGGGTELGRALQTALNLPAAEGHARTIALVTDGFIDCETAVFDLVRNHLDRANLFAFGIGSSVNRFLIEGLARAGQGEPFVVTEPKAAAMEARRFREYIASPVLTGVKVAFQGLETYDVEPASIPDVLADRPVVVTGKWRGQPGGVVQVSGLTGGAPYQQTIPVPAPSAAGENPALAQLWARGRIAMLGDYNRLGESDERVREITSLGLSYGLLTAYTSFVAVDDVVRAPVGVAPRTVKQPLPLPQGVPNSAVGGSGVANGAAEGDGEEHATGVSISNGGSENGGTVSGSSVPVTPEPETWLLMLVAAGVLAWTFCRQRQPAAR